MEKEYAKNAVRIEQLEKQVEDLSFTLAYKKSLKNQSGSNRPGFCGDPF